MIHATDDLEPFVLDALAPADRDRVAAHLGGCASCSERAAELREVVDALPEAAPPREPPDRLRERILASARTATRATAAPGWLERLRAPRPGVLALSGLAAAVLVLGALDLSAVREVQDLSAERDRYEETVSAISQAGRWWYMDGKNDFAGSGGTLVLSRKTGQAFVLFHDLRPLQAGARYAIWLVTPDTGQWVRAKSFAPDGERYQRVDIDLQVQGFDRCAVTVEAASDGRPTGAVIMESRIQASAP